MIIDHVGLQKNRGECHYEDGYVCFCHYYYSCDYRDDFCRCYKYYSAPPQLVHGAMNALPLLTVTMIKAVPDFGTLQLFPFAFSGVQRGSIARSRTFLLDVQITFGADISRTPLVLVLLHRYDSSPLLCTAQPG